MNIASSLHKIGRRLATAIFVSVERNVLDGG
jgi:hypothetical protein